MRYLDPKNDLTFKRVFAEHPHLLISFLNALLPLPKDVPILALEYLPAEILPELPLLKNTIVDVRCTDALNRQFIVEMQMFWTDSFKSRVLFNACKAFVKQFNRGNIYKALSLVYALSIVNENIIPASPIWYHYYQLINNSEPRQVISGLELIFIELPNFKPDNYSQQRLQVLWLRFLKEIENNTTMISQEPLEVPEIAEAVNILKESAYTKAELEQYDKYWDIVSTQKSMLMDSREEGRDEGIEIGENRKAFSTAQAMKKRGYPASEIAIITGLSEEDIDML
jgi:predicted transposase/invertase (TIGR01784 family)